MCAQVVAELRRMHHADMLLSNLELAQAERDKLLLDWEKGIGHAQQYLETKLAFTQNLPHCLCGPAYPDENKARHLAR